MYWGQLPDKVTSESQFEVPLILNEELFPLHDSIRDELLDLCNSADRNEKRWWRNVLRKNVTDYLFNYIKRAVQQGRRLVVYVYGGTGLGKSWVIITLNLLLKEEFEKLGFTTKIIYTENYIETSQEVRNADAGDYICLIQQDEHPKAGGAGSQTELDDFFNCVSQLRWKRYCFFVASDKYKAEFTGHVDFILHVVSTGPELNGGTNAGIFQYGSGREKGYFMLSVNPDHLEEYQHYEKDIKPKHQEMVASSGGEVSASNNVETLEKAARISQKLIELKPDAPKCTNEMIGAAIDALGIKVMTSGTKKESVYFNVKELYEKHLQGRRTRSRRGTQIAQKPPEIDTKASEYSKRGHDEENKLWTEYLPAFFKGTDAKIIYMGQPGEIDGTIINDHTIYICDSKDYCVPVTEVGDNIEYKKIRPAFKRFHEELQRGTHLPILAVMYHEKNRDLWLVKQVRDPENIERDDRGRPKGSLHIDF